MSNRVTSSGYFGGFRWAVPTAFADAIGNCEFQEGDILYDADDAYALPWGQQTELRSWMQIEFPKRGITTEADLGRFESHWRSTVRLMLFDRDRSGGTVVHTTQGRVYTTLWKGSVTSLDTEIEPPIPEELCSVAKRLASTQGLRKLASKHGSVFVMARDETNASSRYKYRHLAEHLKADLVQAPRILRPEDLGMEGAEHIAPTVDIVAFETKIFEMKSLEDRVKEAVYVQARDSKSSAFRLSAHGTIVSP